MNRKLFLASVTAVAAAAGAAFVGSPRAQAAGGRARLDFAPSEMTVAIVGGAPAYYLPFTLKNPMDEARTPRLHLEVRTDTKKTYGDYNDDRVLAAAKKSLRTDAVISTAGLRSKDLAAGASAQAIANFGAIDPNADDLTVRVYGLWDPIVRTRQGKVYKENRVLVLQFAREGDEYDRPLDPIRFVSRKEEVEGEVVELYSTNAGDKKK